MKTKDTNPKQFNIIIKKIAKCDKIALETFYNNYGKLIYLVAFSVVKSYQLADEIVNDVLVRIWQLSPTLTNIKKPIGWLYTVTLNQAKDRLKAEKLPSEIYDIPQHDKNIEEFISNDAFLSKISVLNEEEQQIMILRFVQDLSFKMIAKEINKPISTISSTYYRAIEKLKKL